MPVQHRQKWLSCRSCNRLHGRPLPLAQARAARRDGSWTQLAAVCGRGAPGRRGTHLLPICAHLAIAAVLPNSGPASGSLAGARARLRREGLQRFKRFQGRQGGDREERPHAPVAEGGESADARRDLTAAPEGSDPLSCGSSGTAARQRGPERSKHKWSTRKWSKRKWSKAHHALVDFCGETGGGAQDSPQRVRCGLRSARCDVGRLGVMKPGVMKPGVMKPGVMQPEAFGARKVVLRLHRPCETRHRHCRRPRSSRKPHGAAAPGCSGAQNKLPPPPPPFVLSGHAASLTPY